MSETKVRTSQVGMDEFYEAFCQAQGEYPPIEKKRVGKVMGETKDGRRYEYSFRYADLSDILTAIRPILNKYGLVFIQATVFDNNQMVVVSKIAHRRGGWIESDYPVGKLDATSHQKLGASLTYARRYGGGPLLGVTTEEDVDESGDDQEIAVPEKKAEKPAQRRAPPPPDRGAAAAAEKPAAPPEKTARAPLTLQEWRAGFRNAKDDETIRRGAHAFENVAHNFTADEVALVQGDYEEALRRVSPASAFVVPQDYPAAIAMWFEAAKRADTVERLDQVQAGYKEWAKKDGQVFPADEADVLTAIADRRNELAARRHG